MTLLSPQQRQAAADAALLASSRLAVVQAAGLLDTAPEETFDALSRLATTLVAAPVAFLSIVDTGRDFYKSQHGFPEPLASGRQLEGRTFCHYALASAEPLVIDDTHADPVWRAVPTVTTLGVRAYLGVPVVIDGQPIGSFCVIDSQPRTWTATEIETMTQLGRAAAREIALRGALRAAEADAGRAHALARAHEELLAVVSHDLRSPLQVISLSALLLSSAVDPAGLPHLKRLTAAVDAMKHLVDDLLATHAVQSPASRRSVIATATLLADAAATMETVAERAGVRLSVLPGAAGAVAVDYAQLLRVLCNLVGNCVKYCPSGSTVRLHATRRDAGIEISVADDGPGMSADEQGRAFDRGWQGSLGLSRQDGAGLGLAIVRELVERNGGSATLTTRSVVGTTVTLRFPDVPA